MYRVVLCPWENVSEIARMGSFVVLYSSGGDNDSSSRMDGCVFGRGARDDSPRIARFFVSYIIFHVPKLESTRRIHPMLQGMLLRRPKRNIMKLYGNGFRPS